MSTSSYIEACTTVAAELRETLTSGEIDGLRGELSGLPDAEWMAWMDANHGEIARFLSASPAQRRERRAWTEPSARRWRVVMGAIYMCECTASVLSAADRLQPGGSYRRTAALAAPNYWAILSETGRNPWPFEGPSPFRG